MFDFLLWLAWTDQKPYEPDFPYWLVILLQLGLTSVTAYLTTVWRMRRDKT